MLALRRGATLGVLLAAAWPAAAPAAPSAEKCLAGPATEGGMLSAFPRYASAGARTFSTALFWDEAAPRRPRRPTDPDDPAYRWPAELDLAVGEAMDYDMRIVLTVARTPRWASGGSVHAPPRRNRHFQEFLRAASRRYPSIRLWRIWDDTNVRGVFAARGGARNAVPRRYARLLDASYTALKRASRRNRVIGGSTTSTGDIPPRTFIKHMRLPGGRRPRMDLYGHAPYSARPPAFGSLPPLGGGTADFADLPWLMRWIGRYLAPGRARDPKLWLSKYYLPTDRRGRQFDFFVSRETQADWLGSAMRLTLRAKRIEGLCWERPFDEPPSPKGDEILGGLWDADGKPKPAVEAFRGA